MLIPLLRVDSSILVVKDTGHLYKPSQAHLYKPYSELSPLTSLVRPLGHVLFQLFMPTEATSLFCPISGEISPYA